jgi:hypothetical protein
VLAGSEQGAADSASAWFSPLRTPADVIAWAEERFQARMTTIFNGK